MWKITIFMSCFFSLTIAAQAELTTSITESYHDGEWIESGKTEYSYDVDGNLSERSSSIWDGARWKEVSKSTFTYNGANQITTIIDEETDVLSFNPPTITRHTLSYTNGKLTEDLAENYDGSAYSLHSRLTLVYSNDVLGYAESQLWNGAAWELTTESNKITASYTVDGLVEAIVVENNWDGSAWLEGTRTVRTFDINDRIFSEEFQQLYDGSYADIGVKLEHEYDTNGNRTKTEYFGYSDDGWVLAYDDTFTYDTSVLMSDIVHPFVYSELELLVLGHQNINKPLSQLESDGNGTNSSRLINSYSDDVLGNADFLL